MLKVRTCAHRGLLALLLVGQLIFFWGVPTATSQAAPLAQIPVVRAQELRGSLPIRYNAHYLGLEPTVRDGVVTLTLSYDPQDDPQLRGLINFFVLTEDGLRRYLAGESADDLNFAGGSPLQFDPIGNKMAVAFRDSGRGKYTVIVYNYSSKPVTYTLRAEGGVLIDDANQTLSAAEASAAEAGAVEAETVAPTATPTATPTLAPGVADPATFRLPGSITARRISGTLANASVRHYLNLEPDVRDGLIVFNFRYDPQNVRELTGNINFWILDEHALRRVAAGDEPRDVNLATGFPVPFSPFPNELQASFNTSGSNPYTVVLYNNSPISATYALAVTGGIVIDQYGQTNEAKVAALEAAALSATTAEVLSSSSAAPTPVSTPTPPTLQLTSFTESEATPGPTLAPTQAPTQTIGVERLAGTLSQPYEHHYLALTPTIRDGLIVLTLDVDPKDSQVLAENLNFWVLTEDGLRRVIAGARPEDVGIATGSPVRFGADLGKLRAVINTSGRGVYTIVVFNNSEVPATYLLRANGGRLTDETAQTTLP